AIAPEPSQEVQKPRKIIPVPANTETVQPMVSEQSVAPAAATILDVKKFDLAPLLALLPSISLRSLLKHAVFQFSEDELQITARSEFELGKIREASHLNQLVEALNTLYGRKIQLRFEVQSEKKQDLPSTAGLSNNELQSVFS